MRRASRQAGQALNPEPRTLNPASAALAELDAADADLLASMPVVERLSAADRLARARDLRLDFAEHCHVNTKGQPLDFSEPWLRAMYEENADRVVIMKSVQCGVSEMLVVRALADAAAGRSVFYVLPSYPIRNRFVAQRVDRPLVLVSRYRELQRSAIGDADSRAFKQFGPGAIYFVGSNTPNEFIEISADTAIVDELDRCDAENILLVPDRLSASEAPIQIRVGNPTHDEFGIAAEYDASDQREWQVCCRECGRWQTLDFFSNVLRVTRDENGEIKEYELLDAGWTPALGRDVRLFCTKCGLPLDRLELNRHHAAWRAQEKGSDVRGYHVSKLMSRRARVAPIYLEWCEAQGNATRLARLINNDLGLPYSPAGSTLTDAILSRCVRDHALRQSSAGPCTMGIDVGRVWDVRISDQPERAIRRALLIGRFDGPAPCLELLKRFNVRSCVIDARPETRLAIQFQKAAPKGVVWRCDFAAGESIREPQKDFAEHVVKVDRTAILDEATADFMQGRNWLPASAATLLRGDFYKQLKVPKRILEESERGQRYVWTKGVDHQRLADAYDKLAQLIGGRALAPVCEKCSVRLPGAPLFAEEPIRW